MDTELKKEGISEEDDCYISNAEETEEFLSNFEYTATARTLCHEAQLKLSKNVEPVTTYRAKQIDEIFERTGTFSINATELVSLRIATGQSKIFLD